MSDAAARRREHFRANLRSRSTFWVLFLGLPVAAMIGHQLGGMQGLVGGPLVVLLVVIGSGYHSASKQAEQEFFSALAPSLGLNHTIGGDYVPITPLLAAGDRRRFENTMEGPLFGKLGGPPCLLAHYTYEIVHEHEEVEFRRPAHFTVCAIDVGAPLMRFSGLYLRPRLSGLKLDHDWLARGPKPQRVELESVHFDERYELFRTADQDEVALRELFSPSFVVSLAENPLQPGFECKAGTLVVFVQGHQDSGARLTMLLDTARSITRRATEQGQTHFSAAGQTIL
jgi:hypothetical protein